MSLPKNWSLKQNNKGYFELHTNEGRPFWVSFSTTPPFLSQPLVKAIGFRGNPLSVWDVTAGWGQDAFFIGPIGLPCYSYRKTGTGFFSLKGRTVS